MIPSVFNTDLGGKLELSISPDFKGKIYSIRPLFAGKNRLVGDNAVHLYFYPYWWKPIREFKSHIVVLDEEPWSLCALQFALSGKGSGVKVLFHSKQTICELFPFPFSVFERRIFRVFGYAVPPTEEGRQVLCKKSC